MSKTDEKTTLDSQIEAYRAILQTKQAEADEIHADVDLAHTDLEQARAALKSCRGER